MPDPRYEKELIARSPATLGSPDGVRAQLERILSSADFEATARMRRFLKFVVEMTLGGRADELKGYTIGTEIYGRGPDFNPAEDTVVRIQAGRLRRALEIYYLRAGKNDPISITIPKGTYVPEFWKLPTFESGQPALTPEGTAPAATGPTIVVHPFANLTGDQDRAFFAAGFTEELVTELTHFEDFRVIGHRVAPAHVATAGQDTPTHPEREDVFVVEGSVRMVDQQLKVAVKLMDGGTREILWAEMYRGDLLSASLVRLQETIAEEVVSRIAGEFGIIPHRMSDRSKGKVPNELSSYEAILRGYYFDMVLSKEAFVDAVASLQSAVRREPDCAMVLAMLASLYFTAYALDRPGIDRPLEKGAELIQQAMALDPANQFVVGNMGRLHFIRNERELFLAAMERALQLNPNSVLRVGGLGFYLCLYGDWDRGMPLLERAMRLNPTFPNWFYGPRVLWHFRTLDYSSAYEEALKYSMPNNFWVPMLRASTLGLLGRTWEAGENLSALLDLRPDFPARGRQLIRLFVKEEELVAQITEGLQRAGLEISTAQQYRSADKR